MANVAADSPEKFTDSETPLAGFTVKLHEIGADGVPAQLAASAVTDIKGGYELTGMDPKKQYKIRIEPPVVGENTDFVPHWYDQVVDYNRARIVDVRSGETRIITITAMRKLSTMPMKPGKWVCLDTRSNTYAEYERPQPQLWCTFIKAGASNREMNIRFSRLGMFDSKTGLELSSVQETEGTTDPTPFFFEVDAYWVDTGEAITETEELVTMSIPYNDPSDLYYTPTGATTPTLMSEARLEVNAWNNDNVTAPVTETGSTTSTMKTFAPGWYDPTVEPWCTAGAACVQEVDATNNIVSFTTDEFFTSYALVQGDPLFIYLPFVMKPQATQQTTGTITSTLTLR